jgi:hypothetical protein
MLIDIEGAHVFCMSSFGRVEHLRAVAEATDASEAHNVALFGWDGERVSSKHHLICAAILGRSQ